MSDLRFTVLGKPQPAGSKKAFAHPSTGKIMVVDAAKGSRPWKSQVAHDAQSAAQGLTFDGPVEFDVTFFFARPKSHFGSGRNSGVLKSSAPARPIVRPDCTKLLRAVEDAMTDAGVWRDDAQVVLQHARKMYGFPERCEVVVSAWPVSVGRGGEKEAA